MPSQVRRTAERFLLLTGASVIPLAALMLPAPAAAQNYSAGSNSGNNLTGNYNTGAGTGSISNVTGSFNSGFGYYSGTSISGGL